MVKSSKLQVNGSGVALKPLAIAFTHLLILLGVVDSMYGATFEGWVVGDGGLIYHTTDGGTNWTQQTSVNNAILTAVSFADTNNGWPVDQFGGVIHTSNGGANWSP